jgi:hypothetical protein
MEKFVERENITHYVDQLKTETDPIRRTTLQRLLAEEKAKQASHGKGSLPADLLVESSPKPDYSGRMVPFVYRCPVTGFNAQVSSLPTAANRDQIGCVAQDQCHSAM